MGIKYDVDVGSPNGEELVDDVYGFVTDEGVYFVDSDGMIYIDETSIMILTEEWNSSTTISDYLDRSWSDETLLKVLRSADDFELTIKVR